MRSFCSAVSVRFGLATSAVVASLVLAPGPAPAAAPAGAAVPDTAAKPVEIPFKLRGNHMLVRATVDDSDSLWFIVDTGAMGSVLNRSTAERLKLSVTEGAQARGAGGMVPAGVVNGATIRLPGVVLAGEPIATIALDALAYRTGHPCDGILGAPFFERAVIEIDYARAVLVVHDAKTFVYAGKGATLPLTFANNHPYIQAKVALPDGDAKAGRFVLDTGSAVALILSESFVEKEDATAHVKPVHQVRLGGVGGQMDCPMGRVEALTIGPYLLAAPLAALRTGGGGHTQVDDALGNIGGDVLRRFKVTFDYGRKRAYFEPAATFADNFEADMSGLVFSLRDDTSGAIDVVIVQDASPASEQGVKPGDVLASVDGKPVAPVELVDLRRRLREPGKSVKFEFKRGHVPVAVTLVTRRML